MKRLILTALFAVPIWFVAGCGEPAEPDTSKDKNVVVIIETSKGTIKAELFAEKAPVTVANFLKYVDDRYFDNTTFHRVVPEFMIQGGGWEIVPEPEDLLEEKKDAALGDKKGSDDKQEKNARSRETRKLREKKEGLRSPIVNEASNRLRNKRGTLAMARTDKPDSAASEFFINVKHNGFLDRYRAKDGVGYAVFGRVIEGMDVVDAIENVATKGEQPLKNVFIKSIRRAG